MFCSGSAPTYPTCGTIQTDFTNAWGDAVTFAGSASPRWEGTIFFQGGMTHTNASPFTVDGTDFGGNVPSDFTLAGFGSTGSGATIISGTVSIQNMNSVTLKDMAVLGDDSNGAIVVGNTNPVTGTVTIQNVVVTNTVGSGIQISNVSGGSIQISNVVGNVNPVTDTVTIRNVVVTNTSGSGIQISNVVGNVTLTNVQAMTNTTGAYINNTLGTGNVTINGTNTFGNNGNDGVAVWSKGAIAASGITANENGTNGVYLDNSTGSGDVTLVNVNANNNGLGYMVTGNGVTVFSAGNVSLTNVSAITNTTGYGAYLQSTGGNIAVDPSTFNGNGIKGLYAQTDGSGNITLTDVNANNNGSSGAHLTNATGGSTGSVTITGTNNNFNNNQNGDGLGVYSRGDITVENVTANGNYYAGAYIDNTSGTGSVTITGTNNNFNNNQNGDGLDVYSRGDITVENVTANGNYYVGAYIDNCIQLYGYSSACTGTGTVTVSNSRFGELVDTVEAGNGDKGLGIRSNGDVRLTDVTANYNGNTGAYIDNCIEDYYVYPYACTGTGDVTIDGANNFSSNQGSDTGLHIYSGGLIDVDGVTAEYNLYSEGIHLDNRSSTINAPVSVSNSASNYNAQDGFYILSSGVITLTSVMANGNYYSGAYIDNCIWDYFSSTCTGTGSATINGTNTFNNNTTGNGLEIVSYGDVTLTNVEASGNGVDGATIDNSSSSSAGVTINGTNTFYNNRAPVTTGLNVKSNGPIDVSGVTSTYNDGSGLRLDNASSTIHASVSVSDVVANNNDYKGLYITSRGTVELTNVTANSNAVTGAYIDNCDLVEGCYGTGTVTVSNSTFGALVDTVEAGNGDKGLEIVSSGDVKLTDVTANYNYYSGAYIDNCIWDYFSSACTGTGNVTIDGTNIFSGNQAGGGGSTGLHIDSGGTIDVDGVTAESNLYSEGIYIKNSSSTVNAPVSVSNSASNYNAQDGFYILSSGAITLTSVTANYNMTGAYIDNTPGTGNVTINGTNNVFNNNTTGNGLAILSEGDVTLINVTASNNGSDGANITINGGIVFIDPSYFNGNGGSDLVINGAGNITLDCVTAGNFVYTTGTVTITCSASQTSPTVIIVGSTSPDSGGGTVIVDTLTDFAAFKTPDGISFYSYGAGGLGDFMIFVPDAVWKNAKPGDVIVNCLDSRGYNLRFSRLTDDRIALFGLGNTAPNEGWYLLRWFAPDGRLVNRVYVRLTFVG